MGRPIDEDIVIDIVNFECGKWTGLSKTIEKEIKALPPAQIKYDDEWRQKHYKASYSQGFVDGYKVCERPKGYMKIKVISAVDGEDLCCEDCGAYCLSPSYKFCPKCGVEFIGVRGIQDE